jgi:hypothetical protein
MYLHNLGWKGLHKAIGILLMISVHTIRFGEIDAHIMQCSWKGLLNNLDIYISFVH